MIGYGTQMHTNAFMRITHTDPKQTKKQKKNNNNDS